MTLALTLILTVVDAVTNRNDPEALKHTVAAYVGADGWLLREIEEANDEVGHVVEHYD